MLRRFWIAIPLVITASLANAQEPASRKPLAIEDMYPLEDYNLTKSVPTYVLFPKESKVVYERTWIDAKSKEERHSIWMVTEKTENRKPLEAGEPDGREPVMSPDGEWIVFLSGGARPAGWKQTPSVPPCSDPAVDLWLYHVKSGQVSPLGGPDKPWGRVFHDGFYGRVTFFPANSSKLVFVADEGADPRTKQEIANHVEVVGPPDLGEGYTGYGAAQIWIAEIAPPLANARGGAVAKKITRLTNDDISYGDPQISPDGKSIVVHSNQSDDQGAVRHAIIKNFDLFLIDVATKKQRQLTKNPGPDVSPRFSPDGKQIAYLSSPRHGDYRDDLELRVLALRDGEWQTRLLLDPRNDRVLPILFSFSPVFPLPDNGWSDDETLRFTCKDKLGYPVHSINTKTGNLNGRIGAASEAVAGFGILKRLPDLKEMKYPALSYSSSNRDYYDRIQWRADTTIWQDEKGRLREGNKVIFPEEYIAKPPYKLIVFLDGGPISPPTSMNLFDFTWQLFVAQGYAVYKPRLLGISGLGQKLLDGGEMGDVLTGIDKLVKDGKVDPKRQFVYGVSYGGFMASSLIGKTNRFRAAVAQNAITDMNMMHGLSDVQGWTTWELGGSPWEQPERYRKHSPLTYADKVKTPTLILHSRDDRRCPLPMGKAFHQALLTNGVPTEMVIYPNEGHAIRQPRHREDVYRRVLAWFAKYDVQ